MPKQVKTFKPHFVLSAFIISMISLLIPLSSRALGPAIRYSGFALEKVVELDGNKPAQKDHYCLAIIESSPYESRKVYYTQRQFIDLVRKNPSISQHLEEHLKLPMENLAHFMWSRGAEALLTKTCVGLADLVAFQDKEHKNNFKDLLKKWPGSRPLHLKSGDEACNGPAITAEKWELEFLNKDVFIPEEEIKDERFIIRTYNDPRSEFRKYWRDDHLDETEIRSMDNVGDFLRLSQQFLINNNIVTNKQKGTRYQAYSYPEQEEREKKDKRSVPLEDSQNEDKGDTEVQLDELEKNVAAEHKDREAKEKVLAKRGFSIDDLSVRHLAKRFMLWAKTRKIKKTPAKTPPASLFSEGKLEDPFLMSLQSREKSFDERMIHLEEKQDKLLSKRKSKELSQEPLERYEYLESIVQAGKAKKEEIQEHLDLKSYLFLGEKNFDELEKARNNKKSWKRKIYTPIKTAFQHYNWYVTDTVVDIFTEKMVDASLEQLMPLSKNRARVFRLVKGLDGSFVLSTTIAGYALAPFTFGLSVVAADALKVGMSSVFSIAASAAKKESWDSTFTRAGMRAGHALTEALIPVLGDVNGFFTSLDDLRVAFKVHERFNSLRRGKKGVVKARWETLGSPLVLSFIRDRLNYLSLGLLPRAKFLYAYADLSLEEKREMRTLLLSLEKARRFLIENLTVSRLRYEYLLKSGKIPNFMVKDVVVNLQLDERNRKLFASEKFQEESLWEQMKQQAIRAKMPL